MRNIILVRAFTKRSYGIFGGGQYAHAEHHFGRAQLTASTPPYIIPTRGPLSRAAPSRAVRHGPQEQPHKGAAPHHLPHQAKPRIGRRGSRRRERPRSSRTPCHTKRSLGSGAGAAAPIATQDRQRRRQRPHHLATPRNSFVADACTAPPWLWQGTVCLYICMKTMLWMFATMCAHTYTI